MMVTSETPMTAREYFLQMTDSTNWHDGAGPEWAEAMSCVHEGVMEFWDELEENHGSPTALRIQELERWKAEQLEVEASWDPQAVGRLIGLPLGYPIRPSIQAAIEDLQANVAALEAETARLRAAADRLASKLELCCDDSREPLSERHWWKDEPRCGYSRRYEETAENIVAADEALAAWKEARGE